MSNGYKVDLSALDEVIKKLNQCVDGMGGPQSCAKYETNIPPGWFGKPAEFLEADGLQQTHDAAKGAIGGYIDRVQQLIVKFSSDSAQVRRNYDEQEQRTSQGLSNDTDFM